MAKLVSRKKKKTKNKNKSESYIYTKKGNLYTKKSKIKFRKSQLKSKFNRKRRKNTYKKKTRKRNRCYRRNMKGGAAGPDIAARLEEVRADAGGSGLACPLSGAVCHPDIHQDGIGDHVPLYVAPNLMGKVHIASKFFLPTTSSPPEEYYDCISRDNLHDKMAAYQTRADSNLEDSMVDYRILVDKYVKYGFVLQRYGGEAKPYSESKRRNDTFVGAVSRQQVPFSDHPAPCIYIKDVCTSVKDQAHVLPGYNAMIDQAEQSTLNYLKYRCGMVQGTAIDAILDGGGLLFFDGTSFSVLANIDTEPNPNNLIAHKFSAFFNCDVLIYYQIIKEMHPNALAGTIHQLVFPGVPYDYDVQYANWDAFYTFLRHDGDPRTTRDVITKINIVGFNYLWQKLMSMVHVACTLDTHYREITGFQTVINHIRLMNFVGFEYKSTTIPLWVQGFPGLGGGGGVGGAPPPPPEHMLGRHIFDYFTVIAGAGGATKIGVFATPIPYDGANIYPYATSQGSLVSRMKSFVGKLFTMSCFAGRKGETKLDKSTSVSAINNFIFTFPAGASDDVKRQKALGNAILKFIGDSSHKELGEIIKAGLRTCGVDYKIVYCVNEKPFFSRLVHTDEDVIIFFADGQGKVIKKNFGKDLFGKKDLFYYSKDPDAPKKSAIAKFEKIVGEFRRILTPETLDDLKDDANLGGIVKQKLRALFKLHFVGNPHSDSFFGRLWSREKYDDIRTVLNDENPLEDPVDPNIWPFFLRDNYLPRPFAEFGDTQFPEDILTKLKTFGDIFSYLKNLHVMKNSNIAGMFEGLLKLEFRGIFKPKARGRLKLTEFAGKRFAYFICNHKKSNDVTFLPGAKDTFIDLLELLKLISSLITGDDANEGVKQFVREKISQDGYFRDIMYNIEIAVGNPNDAEYARATSASVESIDTLSSFNQNEKAIIKDTLTNLYDLMRMLYNLFPDANRPWTEASGGGNKNQGTNKHARSPSMVPPRSAAKKKKKKAKPKRNPSKLPTFKANPDGMNAVAVYNSDMSNEENNPINSQIFNSGSGPRSPLQVQPLQVSGRSGSESPPRPTINQYENENQGEGNYEDYSQNLSGSQDLTPGPALDLSPDNIAHADESTMPKFNTVDLILAATAEYLLHTNSDEFNKAVDMTDNDIIIEILEGFKSIKNYEKNINSLYEAILLNKIFSTPAIMQEEIDTDDELPETTINGFILNFFDPNIFDSETGLFKQDAVHQEERPVLRAYFETKQKQHYFYNSIDMGYIGEYIASKDYFEGFFTAFFNHEENEDNPYYILAKRREIQVIFGSDDTFETLSERADIYYCVYILTCISLLLSGFLNLDLIDRILRIPNIETYAPKANSFFLSLKDTLNIDGLPEQYRFLNIVDLPYLLTEVDKQKELIQYLNDYTKAEVNRDALFDSYTFSEREYKYAGADSPSSILEELIRLLIPEEQGSFVENVGGMEDEDADGEGGDYTGGEDM